MDDFISLLNYGIKNKPDELIIDDLKWKLLIRNLLRGENNLLIGPTGCGKTLTVRKLANIFSRNFFIFNCGGTQDSRATLIGNTIYKKETGTIHCPSTFVQAIQIKNSIILLDELSRGSHDCWNILFPVLDTTQRTLRLDEQENSPVINIAEGVCFCATANLGSEYTSTQILDRALYGRFPFKIEMNPLTGNQLFDLFLIHYPNSTKEQQKLMKTISIISDDILTEYNNENGNISTFLSPRSIMKMAELIMDGFSLLEIANISIFSEYTADGGLESERSFVKKLFQKRIDNSLKSPFTDPRKNV